MFSEGCYSWAIWMLRAEVSLCPAASLLCVSVWSDTLPCRWADNRLSIRDQHSGKGHPTVTSWWRLGAFCSPASRRKDPCWCWPWKTHQELMNIGKAGYKAWEIQCSAFGLCKTFTPSPYCKWRMVQWLSLMPQSNNIPDLNLTANWGLYVSS